MTMAHSILPTAVVGSYSMPGWLERAKNDFIARRITATDLDEMHDVAVKAAIKDQETAGVDVISDGELRRDNMIDYFALRLPGVQIDHASKKSYYDYYDSVVRGPMPTGHLGLIDDARFLRQFTDRETKISVTGPHSLVKRIRNEHYPDEATFALEIARIMNLELRDLAAAGVTEVQIDEPYYSGFPEDLDWGIKAINALVDGIGTRVSLHVCYGNRYGKPSWEGSYQYLFPKVLDAHIHQLTLEFARRGNEDLHLFNEHPSELRLGLGVIDVKSHDVETPAVVAERIRRAMQALPAERLTVNPDCGLVHLPSAIAFSKLSVMVQGTEMVRRELQG
jgi:5-methyltetrahydropteroyltriglutamate--homocysteine methyltransferase